MSDTKRYVIVDWEALHHTLVFHDVELDGPPTRDVMQEFETNHNRLLAIPRRIFDEKVEEWLGVRT